MEGPVAGVPQAAAGAEGSTLPKSPGVHEEAVEEGSDSDDSSTYLEELHSNFKPDSYIFSTGTQIIAQKPRCVECNMSSCIHVLQLSVH
jgi:hypothetical protein